MPLLWRYIEWAFVAASLLTASISIPLVETKFNGQWRLWCILLCLLSGFVGLSCMFPSKRSLRFRQGYIAVGMGLSLIGWSVFMLPVDMFLYLYLGKACFLLNRRSLVITVILAGIGLISFDILAVKVLHVNFWSSDESNVLSDDIFTFIVGPLTIFIPVSTFATLFSFAMMAERESRRKAENLAIQVEALAADVERNRIAREIHDSLGHTLTTLNIHLAVAQRLYDQDPSQAKQSIGTAKQIADQCLEDINQTLKAMRYTSFDLNRSLTSLVEQVRQDQSLQVQWDFQIPLLPLPINHHLYYMVKEGLMNIQKHAGASHVSLYGRATSEQIILELSDNGKGFDPQAPHMGFGLLGMKERVQSLGGQLAIESDPKVGTRIQISVPLPPDLHPSPNLPDSTD
jgi:signal transduction histidine kinase